VKLVATLLVAVTVMVLNPAGADVGDVTCNVVDAAAPGPMVRAEAPNVPVHPEGTLRCRVKLEGAQPVLSRLVTVMV
jgi:hypothetical protein